MMVIKRMNPMSVGKIYAVLGAIMGVLVGLMFFAFSQATSSLYSGSSAYGGSKVPQGLLAGLGAFAIIVAPIVYGIGGFIGGVIGAAIYNVVAKWVGGIELDLEQKS